MATKIASDLVAGDRVISRGGETMTVVAVEPVATRRNGTVIRATMFHGDTCFIPASEVVTLAA